MENSSVTCKRVFEPNAAQTSCTGLPPITQYTAGYRFVHFDSNITNVNSTGPNGTTDSKDILAFLIPINSTQCFDTNEASRPCPTSNPVFDSVSKLCANVVTKVTFNFAVSCQGIEHVNVQAVVADGVTESFDQTFSVLFTQNQSFATTFTKSLETPEAHVSGSPGYILGAPVRAAVRFSSSIYMMPPIRVVPGPKREQATEWTHGWWPVFAGGSCEKSDDPPSQIATIRFGVDMQSSCLIRYRMNVSGNGQTAVCQNLQNSIIAFLDHPTGNLNSPIPTHVSRWGNSTACNLDEWLPIKALNSSVTPQPSLHAGPRSCHNIVIGQTILFIYAKRGRVYKPQNEILAISKVYHLGTIKFKCGGRFCTANNLDLEQTMPIQTIVRFKDISLPPNWQPDRAPVDEVDQLTGDLYYPFQVERKASWMV
ncbi:unnamed protein product [Echinostoma caproni]|uniref:Tectonic-1-3 domain-containing protein n=1 Tax=Echinostoma caproni TaxID=27848 RepID=A0A3P8H0W1_9TREM|nr:unnamed protein product [Echinostoma caproni]